jgi:hypothetical protein
MSKATKSAAKVNVSKAVLVAAKSRKFTTRQVAAEFGKSAFAVCAKLQEAGKITFARKARKGMKGQWVIIPA